MSEHDLHLLACKQDKELAALRQQLADALAWKESAISVTPDMQEIGRLLSVGLGESIHDKIVPGIEQLIRERDELAKEVERLSKYDPRKRYVITD